MYYNVIIVLMLTIYIKVQYATKQTVLKSYTNEVLFRIMTLKIQL